MGRADVFAIIVHITVFKALRAEAPRPLRIARIRVRIEIESIKTENRDLFKFKDRK
jgi:hypothetical protein